MGVEPQHHQRPPGAGAMAHGPIDGAERQAVVAPGGQRHRPLVERRLDGLRQRLRPGGHRRQARGAGRESGGGDVAPVLHRVAEVPQRAHQPGGAQGRRPHERPRLVGADLDRRADQGDALRGRVGLMHRRSLRTDGRALAETGPRRDDGAGL